MKRYLVIIMTIAIVLGVMSFMLMTPTKPVRAGGLPCFMCHGMDAQGSDLAPRLAGTLLTDEQILKQVRAPRGVMPAFPEFSQSFVVDWIRQAPTGQPTMTLAAEQRSSALSMIAAAAAARATDVLKATTVTASPTRRVQPSRTPSPSPTVAITAMPDTITPNPPGITGTAFSAGWQPVLIPALLVLMLGSVWFTQRRRKSKG